ncbi:hypothetical protein DFR49_0944 [Hephaestia caeni]|uniref:DUF7007 domain-containing protein n=1 Tax=Hephaestia caeni TaxID=645617 RepID=A0A397PDC5_9SPHN|nr:hypothetical protein [Hephaestia caeni]RIA46403.1 hypothetical protein DFR49_0944 [Hephaestia caeni]
MTHFSRTPKPSHSPWGQIDYADQIVPGVWSVGTPSHGGFLLSPERQTAMPAVARRAGAAYEEDAEWSLVALVFADEFSAISCAERTMADIARDHVRNYYPDEYAHLTGDTPTAETSHVLRRREICSAAIGQFVVTSAFGDWADWVPDGKVGIIAREAIGITREGHYEYGDVERRGLVDAARYDNRAIVSLWDDLNPALCDEGAAGPLFRKTATLTIQG